MPRSWTQPCQSAGPMRFGVVKIAWSGTRIRTGASSSVIRAVSSMMRGLPSAVRTLSSTIFTTAIEAGYGAKGLSGGGSAPAAEVARRVAVDRTLKSARLYCTTRCPPART